MAPTSTSPRGYSAAHRPIRSNRTRVQSYNEESGSDDDATPDRSERLSLSLRPRDSNRIPSYREDSTDDELEFASDGVSRLDADMGDRTQGHSSVTAQTQSTPSRKRRKQTVTTRSQTQRRNKRTPTKQSLELGRPLYKRRKVEENDSMANSRGVIPPWQTLPYHILFDIFLRASHPLVNERATKRHRSVNWLVNVALLCRSFHEPALAALYHSPPLLPAAKSHGLLSLLEKPQDTLSTNYVNKVKELHVDVENLLVYKSGPTLGYFDLPKLVENTPQVRVLRLYHSQDYLLGLPPWQIPRSRWTYPDSLFTSIASTSTRLYGWDWNARFMPTQELLPLMLETHRRPSFKSIRELRILHAASEDMEGDAVVGMDDDRESVLAMGLAELTNLRRLEFLESSIVNDQLFPILPSNLTSLTINNCDEVTTANFRAFLSTHGHSLRELNLSHNRHLSLSFIVGLKEFCPSLETFTVDISIHDSSSFHDVEPHFEELLRPSEIPTWPTTLQQLELIQLRKWNEREAEGFFASLIEAAPELKNLRRLVISAILKTSWRDRASFRERWIGKLEKVFLRHSAPPNPAFHSIPRQPQENQTNPNEESIPGEGESLSRSKRKSARIAQRKHSDGEDDHSPSPRSHRMHEDDDDHDLAGIQGMCDAVVIRIDNQRPRDMQFNEEDFLDDEVSGDEDWTGHDLDINGAGHAW
ncbi:hypothetical protein BJX61DRAFT_459809 [Aspergillus egyptiacus]|nr:hypothetical protein BJX61DRAFT_459809 [Aspergillus egyptiacus]